MKFRVGADQVEKAIEAAAMSVVLPKFDRISDILSEAAETARSNVLARAAAKLSPRELVVYEKGLKLSVTSGANSIAWELSLEGEAQRVEGFSPFDMIASGLVRGGKSKYSNKTGRRYVIIPFERPGMYSKVAKEKAGNIVQANSPTPTTRGNLAEDLRMMVNRAQPFISAEGQATTQGKVWNMTKDAVSPQWNFYDYATKKKEAVSLKSQPSPLMSGITAVKTGNKMAYFTWRTATDPRMPDKPKSWMHPGVQGQEVLGNMIQDLIKDAQAEIDLKISELFRD